MKIISPWKKLYYQVRHKTPQKITLLWELSVINFTAKQINTWIPLFSDRIWEARAQFLVFLFSPENVKHIKKEYLKLFWDRSMTVLCILLIIYSIWDWEASKTVQLLRNIIMIILSGNSFFPQAYWNHSFCQEIKPKLMKLKFKRSASVIFMWKRSKLESDDTGTTLKVFSHFTVLPYPISLIKGRYHGCWMFGH